jgi:hypothetical protein
MGMIKRDETFYQIIPGQPAPEPAVPR